MDILSLVVWLCTSYIVFMGSWIPAWITDWRAWYPFHERPLMYPPYWIFGPVWALTYTLFAIATHIAYQNGASQLSICMHLAHLSILGVWTTPFYYWAMAVRSLILLIVSFSIGLSTLILYACDNNVHVLSPILYAIGLLPIAITITCNTYLIVQRNCFVRHDNCNCRLHVLRNRTLVQAILENYGIQPDIYRTRITIRQK